MIPWTSIQNVYVESEIQFGLTFELIIKIVKMYNSLIYLWGRYTESKM